MTGTFFLITCPSREEYISLLYRIEKCNSSHSPPMRLHNSNREDKLETDNNRFTCAINNHGIIGEMKRRNALKTL